MSEEERGCFSYPRIQYSIIIDKEQLVARSQTGEDLLSATQEMAKVSTELAEASTTIKNAFGIMKAQESTGTAEPAAKKSYGRTVKPGAKPATPVTTGGKVCKHGLEWLDLNGTYKKDGSPPAKRFYCQFEGDWKERCPAWGGWEA